jgi:zinc protease
MPLLAFLLSIIQIAPVPLPLPPLDVGGEIVGPYIFREDVGQTTKVILQNGLTVIVREQNAVPLVSITTLVKVGYFDEPDEISGISHVIEHMFFKGTSNRGVGQVALETRGLGGTLNAYTTYDRTVYHVVAPAANAVPTMEIQADAFWNPVFDAAELEREIEVVLQENNRKLDSPRAVAEERLYATAYTAHRMHRWRIGTPDGLRSLSRDDLVRYYDRYYQPSNVVLAVVGQFNREDMLAEVVRLYGGAEDAPVERDQGSSEGQQAGVRYGWERASIGESHAAMGFHVPGVLAEQAYALEVLSGILTTGRASRFNRILRDEAGVVVRASSVYTGFRDMGFFRIHLEGPTPMEAERAVVEELERIRRFGVTAEELARAKGLIASDHFRRLETVEGTADQLAVYEALGDWQRLYAFLRGVQSVTADQVQNVVSQYFTSEGASVFEYVTESAQIAQTESRLEADVFGAVANMVQRSREELPVSALELPVSALIPQEDGSPILSDLVSEPETLSILRGPDVHIVGDGRLPLVSFGIFYPGGRLYEGTGNAGITELMLRSSVRGTRSLGSGEIARRLENAGARIELVNEPDFFGYILEGLSGSLREALDVLMEVVQEPTFPESLVLQEQQLQQARLRQFRDDNLRYPVQVFMETLFGDHPYGRPALGLEASVGQITRDDVASWHREQLRGVMPVIVIVGDTSGSTLVYSITEALTNEDLLERDLPELALPAAEAVSEDVADEVVRRQSVLVYGTTGPAFRDADRVPLSVLEHVMSGLGGRLFDSIREKAGLAYTVRTFDDFRATAGAFFTYTAFSPANQEDVRSLLDAGIRELAEEGVTEDEMERARNSAVGAHEAGLQSRRARTLAFARALIAGSDERAVTDYSRQVRALDKETVDAAASQYLRPESSTVVVVRGVQ